MVEGHRLVSAVPKSGVQNQLIPFNSADEVRNPKRWTSQDGQAQPEEFAKWGEAVRTPSVPLADGSPMTYATRTPPGSSMTGSR